jgi:hypothetical protein
LHKLAPDRVEELQQLAVPRLPALSQRLAVHRKQEPADLLHEALQLP